jgi:hypothetical protein
MKLTTATIVMGLVVSWSGCSPGDDAGVPDVNSRDSAPEPAETESLSRDLSPPATNVDQRAVSGEVIDVDQDLGTFTLRDDDDDRWQFVFSDSTEITGGTAAQGLAGTEGNRAIVYYLGDDPVLRRAVSIEILDSSLSEPSVLP